MGTIKKISNTFGFFSPLVAPFRITYLVGKNRPGPRMKCSKLTNHHVSSFLLPMSDEAGNPTCIVDR